MPIPAPLKTLPPPGQVASGPSQCHPTLHRAQVGLDFLCRPAGQGAAGAGPRHDRLQDAFSAERVRVSVEAVRKGRHRCLPAIWLTSAVLLCDQTRAELKGHLRIKAQVVVHAFKDGPQGDHQAFEDVATWFQIFDSRWLYADEKSSAAVHGSGSSQCFMQIRAELRNGRTPQAIAVFKPLGDAQQDQVPWGELSGHTRRWPGDAIGLHHSQQRVQFIARVAGNRANVRGSESSCHLVY